MKHLKKIFLIVAALFISNLAMAQDNDPGDPDSVPIDGGVSLLVGAAAIYGAKKLRDKNREKQQDK